MYQGFKHPHLDTLRNVMDSKPAMPLPNYSLTIHSPYRWKPELAGLTTLLLMESEDADLPIPLCDALSLIATSEPVKQVDIFREVTRKSRSWVGRGTCSRRSSRKSMARCWRT